MPDKNKQRPTVQNFTRPVNVDEPLVNVPPQVAVEPTGWIAVVATEYLSVRSAPNQTAEVLLILTRGKTYMVEASGRPWLKIKHPKLIDRIGYVSCTILKDQPEK